MCLVTDPFDDRRLLMAEGLSPPSWARDENATTPTPVVGGSCGHRQVEYRLAIGIVQESQEECLGSRWHENEGR